MISSCRDGSSLLPLLSEIRFMDSFVTRHNIRLQVNIPTFVSWIFGSLAGLGGLFVLAPRFIRRQNQRELARAIQQFKLRREVLEAKFVDLAKSLGKPRGLRWTKCDWKTPVRFVRDRSTGLLTAFASVEIHFEAIEGGDMEDVAAVGDVRDASAVFHFQNGNWGTGGKALFNMNPETAVSKLEHQFESVET